MSLCCPATEQIVEGFPQPRSSKSSSHPCPAPAPAPAQAPAPAPAPAQAPAPAPPTSCHSPSLKEQQEVVPPDTDRVVLYKLETARDADRKSDQNADLSVRQIQEFLKPGSDLGGEEEEEEEEVSQYLLPAKTLLRYALLMDIVTANCRRSVCFTKGCVSEPGVLRSSWGPRKKYNIYIFNLKTQDEN